MTPSGVYANPYWINAPEDVCLQHYRADSLIVLTDKMNVYAVGDAQCAYTRYECEYFVRARDFDPIGECSYTL
jgi:hypothetical protein